MIAFPGLLSSCTFSDLGLAPVASHRLASDPFHPRLCDRKLASWGHGWGEFLPPPQMMIQNYSGSYYSAFCFLLLCYSAQSDGVRCGDTTLHIWYKGEAIAHDIEESKNNQIKIKIKAKITHQRRMSSNQTGPRRIQRQNDRNPPPVHLADVGIPD